MACLTARYDGYFAKFSVTRVLCAAALLSSTLGYSQQFFPFSIDQDQLSGAPDLSSLNHPIAPGDRLKVCREHFCRSSDGVRVRLFAVNLAFGANFLRKRTPRALANDCVASASIGSAFIIWIPRRTATPPTLAALSQPVPIPRSLRFHRPPPRVSRCPQSRRHLRRPQPSRRLHLPPRSRQRPRTAPISSTEQTAAHLLSAYGRPSVRLHTETDRGPEAQ
jgi:hypothetical protein